MLQRTSEKVFVPLTVGGGIRDFKDKDGRCVFTSLKHMFVKDIIVLLDIQKSLTVGVILIFSVYNVIFPWSYAEFQACVSKSVIQACE